MRSLLLGCFGLGAAVACGGAASGDRTYPERDGGGGIGGSAGGTAPAGGTAGKRPKPRPDAGPVRPDARPPKDASPDIFVDPGCPDAPPNPVMNECDPLGPPEIECGFGNACYPYVDYPSGKCGQEQYGTVCAPAGSGMQGEPCGYTNCAPGFVCVTGTGQGVICVQMCDLNGRDDCPPGFLCRPVDVAGIGGCI